MQFALDKSTTYTKLRIRYNLHKHTKRYINLPGKWGGNSVVNMFKLTASAIAGGKIADSLGENASVRF